MANCFRRIRRKIALFIFPEFKRDVLDVIKSVREYERHNLTLKGWWLSHDLYAALGLPCRDCHKE